MTLFTTLRFGMLLIATALVACSPAQQNPKALREAIKRYPPSQSDGSRKHRNLPAEFFAYREQIMTLVQEHWTGANPRENREVTVQFNLSEDGSISSTHVIKSSGDSQFDKLALQSVERANPLPPPPRSVIQFFEKVKAVFSANVLDSKRHNNAMEPTIGVEVFR